MNEKILLYILIALSGLCLALLIVLLSRKKDGGTKEALEEIIRQNTSFSAMLKNSAENTERLIDRSNALEERHNIALRQDIGESFEKIYDLVAKINKDNGESRVQMLKEVSLGLENIRKANEEQSMRQSRTLSESIEKLQLSNEKKLEEMRKTVDEKLDETLGARLDSTFKAVSEQLQNVYKSLGEMKELSSGVTTNVTSLNRILTNVKARGTWAEIQLEGILDQTIPGMYDKNVATDKTGSARVEFAVRIPSGDDKESFVYLPIDSKFPVEDYIRLCEAADNADPQGVTEARKALERRVLQSAKDITKYIHEPETTPFAIMYLATEGLYSEIISSQSAIAERLHNEFNIMVAGPSTITALLNSLSMGFRAIAINEKAKEIRELLSAVRAQYDKFGEILVKAKKKIEEAGNTLDDAKHRNDIIQKRLRSVGEIDSAQADGILGLTDGSED